MVFHGLFTKCVHSSVEPIALKLLTADRKGWAEEEGDGG